MSKKAVCRDCFGTQAQHSQVVAVTGLDWDPDEGCWCPRCLSKPVEDRCRSFRPDDEIRAVERPVASVGHAHPETAKAAAAVAQMRAGTHRKETFALIQGRGEAGLTDDEMEKILGRSHQSVSATRNSLMNDGLIVDSGKRRRTRWDNAAIVWVVRALGPQEDS